MKYINIYIYIYMYDFFIVFQIDIWYFLFIKFRNESI